MMAALRFRELPAIVPGKLDVFTADPREIIVMADYNSRDMTSAETLAHVDWIADEIEVRGFIPEMPLTVRRDGDQIILVRGHCRLAACMKLIEKGVEIDGVPVMQITAGMSDVDLIFDQQTSNNGLRLDEFAKGRMCLKARRLGMDDKKIAERMHWKDVASVQTHIKMVEIVPEPVKQQVAQGDISATEAMKLIKTLPAGTDPNEAAKIIAANKEENKRLGVGKRTQHKVTAKTLQRDRPKAEPKNAAEAKPDNITTHTTVLPPEEIVTTQAPETGSPVSGASSLDQLQEQIAGLTGVDHVRPIASDMMTGDGANLVALTQDQHGEKHGIASFAAPRPSTKIEALLVGFATTNDVNSLAFHYVKLLREHDEAGAAGEETLVQRQLCVACDVAGSLRFPEDWENAKATTELAQVA